MWCAGLVVLQVVASERAANEPPRLGKQRFEAPGVAVLTSDEVTGSLRQLQVRFLAAAVVVSMGFFICMGFFISMGFFTCLFDLLGV